MLRKFLLLITDRESRRRFLRFSLIGCSSFCFEYLIFTMMNLLIGESVFKLLWVIPIKGVLVANAASFFAAFWYCFILNKIWTFHSSGKTLRRLSMFALLFFCNMILSCIFIHYTEMWLRIDPQLGKVVAALIISVWNYFIYKKIIFK